MAASLDRFLTRAIIALAFLIFGLVGGYVLASRFPGIVPVEPAPAAKTAAKDPGKTEPETPAKTETSGAPEPTSGEPGGETGAATSGDTSAGEGGSETGGSETGGSETGGSETGGDETGAAEGETGAAETGEAVDPGPPPPLSGKFVIEIRDVVGTTRDKAVVRELASAHAHEVEACLLAPGNLSVARLHYQLAVNAAGDVVESLMLQGVEPTVDACVVEAIRKWNWGPTTEGSFFKLKYVWTA